jgi:trigger factor
MQENNEIEYPIVNSNEIEYCKLSVSYEADPDVVNDKIDEAIVSLRKVQIPGFRKGKAPDHIIKIRCKDRINQWVTREMAAQAYDDMVFETGVKPIGHPDFKDIDYKEKMFKCNMIVPYKPSFELEDFSTIKIEPYEGDVDIDQKVEESIKALQLRAGDVEPYGEDDVVSLGDNVTMSFTATIEGLEFEGSVVEGELYTVGSNKFPDFDDYILGMKAGEDREFEIVFPEEYPEIGGKTAKFNVTIHMGMTKKPAALDENFFKICNCQDLEGLKVQLTQISKAQLIHAENDHFRKQVSKKLVEMHDFKVPNFLIEQEVEFLAKKNDIKGDSYSKDLLEQAEKNCKLSLILDSIKEDEPDSVLDEDNARANLYRRFQMQGKDPEKSLVEAQKDGSITMMLAALQDEFTLQWVINEIKEKNEQKSEEANCS